MTYISLLHIQKKRDSLFPLVQSRVGKKRSQIPQAPLSHKDPSGDRGRGVAQTMSTMHEDGVR